MTTPKNNTSLLRVGLSRPSSSSKKKLTITPSIPANVNANEFTPSVSSNSKAKGNLIKRKKLEFAAEKYLNEKCENEPEKDLMTTFENLDIDEMKELIEEKKRNLEILQRYQAEKEELIKFTVLWKQAGLDAIERLRQFTNDSNTDEEILDNFNIPHEVFLS